MEMKAVAVRNPRRVMERFPFMSRRMRKAMRL